MLFEITYKEIVNSIVINLCIANIITKRGVFALVHCTEHTDMFVTFFRTLKLRLKSLLYFNCYILPKRIF